MTEPRTYAVIDIDGVVADVRHRVRFVHQRPKDWDAFFSAAVDDPPLAVGLQRVHDLAQECTVVYLTGRPERCRNDTQTWLQQHGLPQGRLIMRSDRDRRPARFTKLEALRALGAEAEVAVVIDDDERVIAELTSAGYVTEHATWMNESYTQRAELRQAQETEGRT